MTLYKIMFGVYPSFKRKQKSMYFPSFMLGVKVSQAAVQRVQDWRFQRVAECITGATCTKIVTLRH